MKFLFTRYIYPLAHPVALSEELGIILDNPRTEPEVDIIQRYLIYSNSVKHVKYNHNFIVPFHQDESSDYSIEGFLHDFFDTYIPQDLAVQRFYEQHKQSDLWTLLARMWIILRFDPENHCPLIENGLQPDTGDPTIWLAEWQPMPKCSLSVVNYAYLLSLLIQTDTDAYSGGSFLLHHDCSTITQPKLDVALNQHIRFNSMLCGCGEQREISEITACPWMYYPFIRHRLLHTVQTLDPILNEHESREKILYIASLLKAASEIDNDTTKLVVLVSIMELLLTHSPDFNRFNVEDSITKQFVLKASILIYQNNPSRDLHAIKKRLRTIYMQRSNIAHGNFKNLEKYLYNLSQTPVEDTYFTNLITDSYKFIRAIVEEYIKDRDFVEFLKEN